MSEPFLGWMKAVSMVKIRSTLRQAGVSHLGVTQFLQGTPVVSASDRHRLAQLLIRLLGDSRVKPAEFKPAEFKPARR